MNINLPTGGKSQPNSAPVQSPAIAGNRVVRVERLQKLTIEQLEAKISNLPEKIKRKTEIAEKRIAKMREKLTAYTDYCKRTEIEIKRLLVEKRKAASVPNAGPVKAA
jgi:pyrrolidone-carboxylate peptidase